MRYSLLFSLLVLLSFAAHACSAECLANACLNDADCASCGFVNTTSYEYAQFKYVCQGALRSLQPQRTPHKFGACIVDPKVMFSEAFTKAVLLCKEGGNGHRCCDLRQSKEAQVRHCSMRSCRVATGCSVSGACEYDTSDAARGNTLNCCDKDADCPPFGAPAFWDESLASSTQRICERPRCNTESRTCEYVRAKDCCVADSPDCDTFTLPSAKCTVGACVYDAGVASAVKINPFKDPESMKALATQSIMRNESYLRATAFVASRSPLQCQMRLRANCECESHTDCVQYQNECATARCEVNAKSSRRVCVTRPAREAPAHCCRGANTDGPERPLSSDELHEQCSAHLQDSCQVPVTCDSHGTRLHDDGSGLGPANSALPYGELLLPTFRCSYVRRTGTASCCSYKGDCAELANVNECVLDECDENPFTKSKQCLLNERGYAFAHSTLPCCYTDDDCRASERLRRIPRRLAELFGAGDNQCAALRCTGDDQSVPPAMRHKCVPEVFDECPSISKSVRANTRAQALQLRSKASSGELESVSKYLVSDDVRQHLGDDHIDAQLTFHACDAAMEVVIPLHLAVDAADTQAVASFAYPLSVRVSVFGFVNPPTLLSPAAFHEEFQNAVLSISVVDTVNDGVLFELDEAASYSRSARKEAQFVVQDRESSVPEAATLSSVSLEVRVLLNTSILLKFPQHAQKLFDVAQPVPAEHIVVRWPDNSNSTLLVNELVYTSQIDGCALPSPYTDEDKTGVLDYIDEDNVRDALRAMHWGDKSLPTPFAAYIPLRLMAAHLIPTLESLIFVPLSSALVQSWIDEQESEEQIAAQAEALSEEIQVTIAEYIGSAYNVDRLTGDLYPQAILVPLIQFFGTQGALNAFTCGLESGGSLRGSTSFFPGYTDSYAQRWWITRGLDFSDTLTIQSVLIKGVIPRIRAFTQYKCTTFAQHSPVASFTSILFNHAVIPDPYHSCFWSTFQAPNGFLVPTSSSFVNPLAAPGSGSACLELYGQNTTDGKTCSSSFNYEIRMDTAHFPYDESATTHRVTAVTGTLGCFPGNHTFNGNVPAAGYWINFVREDGVTMTVSFALAGLPYVEPSGTFAMWGVYDFRMFILPQYVSTFFGKASVTVISLARSPTLNAGGAINIYYRMYDCDVNPITSWTTGPPLQFCFLLNTILPTLGDSSSRFNLPTKCFSAFVYTPKVVADGTDATLGSILVYYGLTNNRLRLFFPSLIEYQMQNTDTLNMQGCYGLAMARMARVVGATSYAVGVLAAARAPADSQTSVIVFAVDPARLTDTPDFFAEVDIGLPASSISDLSIDYEGHAPYNSTHECVLVSATTYSNHTIVFRYCIPLFNVSVNSALTCTYGAQIYCDGFSRASCHSPFTAPELMHGWCVPGEIRKCIPNVGQVQQPNGTFGFIFDMTGVVYDENDRPVKLLRNATATNTVPVQDPRSFCWALPGQCLNPSNPTLSNAPQFQCDCACGCVKSVASYLFDQERFYSNCLQGDPNLPLQPGIVDAIDLPTPMPVPNAAVVPTGGPTLMATPAPTPATCGLPAGGCIELFCNTLDSTCNTTSGKCIGGCRPPEVDACTVNSDCNLRDCCGCLISVDLGYKVCNPLVPPTPAPTPPTPSPTVVPGTPTAFPTPAPPTFPPSPPTPAPTPIVGSGSLDQTAGLDSGCINPFHLVTNNSLIEKNHPWYGVFTGAIDPLSAYDDDLPDTTVTLRRYGNSCTGCVLDFSSSRCARKCYADRTTSTAYSYYVNVEVINNSTRVQQSIPENAKCSAKDGFVMVFNVTGCNNQLRDYVALKDLPPYYGANLGPDHYHICTAITPISSSVIISPPEMFDVMQPGVSLHSYSKGGDHAYFVLRANCLPVGVNMTFNLRVEGCTTVDPTLVDMESCFDVTARIITGKCTNLLHNWAQCALNEFASGPDTATISPYAYRKCIHRDRHIVTQVEGVIPGSSPIQTTSQFGNCTRCNSSVYASARAVSARAFAAQRAEWRDSSAAFALSEQDTFLEPTYEVRRKQGYYSVNGLIPDITVHGEQPFIEQFPVARALSHKRNAHDANEDDGRKFGKRDVEEVEEEEEEEPLFESASALAAIPAITNQEAHGPVVVVDDTVHEIVSNEPCVLNSSALNEDFFNRTQCPHTSIHHRAQKLNEIFARCALDGRRSARTLRFRVIIQHYSNAYGYDDAALDDDDTNVHDAVSGHVQLAFSRAQPYLPENDPAYDDDDASPLCAPLQLLYAFERSNGDIEINAHPRATLPDADVCVAHTESEHSRSATVEREDSVRAEFLFSNLLPTQSITVYVYYFGCDFDSYAPTLQVGAKITKTDAENVVCHKKYGQQRCRDYITLATNSSAPVATFSCTELDAANACTTAAFTEKDRYTPLYIWLILLGVVLIIVLLAVCIMQIRRRTSDTLSSIGGADETVLRRKPQAHKYHF